MSNLENIVLDGKDIDLNSLTLDDLKGILDRINAEEKVIKQEINDALKKLA